MKAENQFRKEAEEATLVTNDKKKLVHSTVMAGSEVNDFMNNYKPEDYPNNRFQETPLNDHQPRPTDAKRAQEIFEMSRLSAPYTPEHPVPHHLPSQIFQHQNTNESKPNPYYSKPSSPFTVGAQSPSEFRMNFLKNSSFGTPVSLILPHQDLKQSHLIPVTESREFIENQSYFKENYLAKTEFIDLPPEKPLPSRKKGKLVYTEMDKGENNKISSTTWRSRHVICTRCAQHTSTVLERKEMRTCSKVLMLSMAATVCLSVPALVLYLLPCSFTYSHRCDNCGFKLSSR